MFNGGQKSSTSAKMEAAVKDISNYQPLQYSIFQKVKRSVYVIVHLDAIANNVALLRACCENSQTGVIGVVKGGTCGHGSVHVSRHLKAIGVERLAVATVDEAIHLRHHDISGPIHIFDNTQAWDIHSCLQYNLTSTVWSRDIIKEMALALESAEDTRSTAVNDRKILPRGAVNIKIDSGMSRNGCQPDELRHIFQSCEDLDVPIDSIFTHFADSSDDAEFTRQQHDIFQEAVEPFRGRRRFQRPRVSAGCQHQGHSLAGETSVAGKESGLWLREVSCCWPSVHGCHHGQAAVLSGRH